MSESARLVVAVILSVVIIGGWQLFYVMPLQKERAAFEASQKRKTQEQAPLTDSASTKAALPSAPVDRSELLTAKVEGGRVKISSARLHGSIALTGARLDDLTLADYKVEQDPGSPEVVLLSPQGATDTYFADFGWLAGDDSVAVPGKNTVWNADSAELTPENPLTLRWDNGQGLTFIREVALDKDYLFTITDKVENASGSDVTLYPFGLINRTRLDTETYYVSHEGMVGVFGDVLEEATYKTLQDEYEDNDKGKLNFDADNGWVGIADKYWLTALIPQQGVSTRTTAQYYLTAEGQKRYQVNYRSEGKKIAAGEEITITQRLFAGAKEVSLLDHYSKEHGIALFDRAVDFGSLYFLTRPMFVLLDFLYGILGNFGMAIIVMTIIIKALLFPLANKSYKSMARLKEHMPEMMKIKERFSHDKPKMNQEMMAFYKDNRINPMSGCLPLLLQIPIFFSLYKVIFITIEMRHAPFFWWITDLSAQDSTNIINLFGLLPFAAPGWMPEIGALACLFSLTMMIQQLLSPPPADETQKMIMRWMPVFLLFVFAGFPSGLLVYWVWSNILSIMQQYVITRHIHKKDD